MSPELSTLSLREVAHLLKYKDTRSARRWCQNHGVAVFTDTGAKTPYVITAAFTAARLTTLTAYLKEKYGSKWKDYITAYLSGDIGWIIARTSITHKETPPVLGIHGTRFLSDLKQSISDTHTHE